MSEEVQEQAVEEAETATAEENETNEETATQSSTDEAVSEPVYPQVQDTKAKPVDPSIQRFLDVRVNVSAELGSVSMPLGNLLELGEGSVIELERSINTPIDLMAQGVRVATGEVVVVDDCFAIRIREIEKTKDQEPPAA